jgi:hypothetical protein
MAQFRLDIPRVIDEINQSLVDSVNKSLILLKSNIDKHTPEDTKELI